MNSYPHFKQSFNQNAPSFQRAGMEISNNFNNSNNRINQQANIQRSINEDLQAFQLLGQYNGNRKSGFEGADILFQFAIQKQQQQPQQIPFQQIQNPYQQGNLYQKMNAQQSSNQYSQQQQQPVFQDKVTSQIERQNQILTSLSSNFKMNKQDQGQIQQFQMQQSQKNLMGHSYPSSFQTYQQQDGRLQNNQFPPPILMPPKFGEVMRRGDEENEIAEKIRMLQLLKKVRDENIMLKKKIEIMAQSQIQKPYTPQSEQSYISNRKMNVAKNQDQDIRKQTTPIPDDEDQLFEEEISYVEPQKELSFFSQDKMSIQGQTTVKMG